jgi:hypothetical protein
MAEDAMMRRFLGIAAVMVLLVVSCGCTENKSKPTAPDPINPQGSQLDARSAFAMAKDYVSGVYEGSTVVVPFTLTKRMLGVPCAWNGTESGNSTKWMMYIEGIMLQLGVFRHITVPLQALYKDGSVNITTDKPYVWVIQESEVNQTYYSLAAESLEGYMGKRTNHEVFLMADATKGEPPANHYLYSAAMTLDCNNTSPVTGTAAWSVQWKYLNNDNFKAKNITVVLDATTGKVLKTE